MKTGEQTVPTLAELEAEIKVLQERLRVTTGLAEAMRAYEAAVGVKIHNSGNVTVRQRAQPSRRSAPAMAETERAATDLMVRTGGPVATADVVKEMISQGMSVPAGNAVNVISARLSNNPKFKGKRGVGYWLADRPWPGEEAQEPLSLNENESPSGGAAGASEAGGAATPSNHQPQTYDL